MHTIYHFRLNALYLLMLSVMCTPCEASFYRGQHCMHPCMTYINTPPLPLPPLPSPFPLRRLSLPPPLPSPPPHNHLSHPSLPLLWMGTLHSGKLVTRPTANQMYRDVTCDCMQLKQESQIHNNSICVLYRSIFIRCTSYLFPFPSLPPSLLLVFTKATMLLWMYMLL